MRKYLAACAFALAMIAISTSAWADAIDGKWCDGTRQIIIDGPTITLPSGNRHQGDYTRHTFNFVVPDGEENAGDRWAMVVQSDELMHIQSTPKGATAALPVVPWRRCVNIS